MTSIPAWLKTTPPTVGLHLDAERVTAVQVERDGATPVIRAVASSALPTGAIVPSLTGHNVAQRDVVVRAIRGAIEELGGRPRRVALVVPDAAAKVSLLPFEQVPSNPRDLEQLLRLHLRKTVPFPVDEAQITWARGGALDGATTMIVTAMRRAIVEEYEAVCAAAGLHAGTVDIATFNVLNLALLTDGTGAGDSLLVHVTPGYASIGVLRDGALIFFRTRPHDASEPVADVVHQTRMYYEDRLGGQGFARVRLVAGPDVTDRAALATQLAALIEHPLVPLSLEGLVQFGDRIGVNETLVGQIAAATGLVLRESAA